MQLSATWNKKMDREKFNYYLEHPEEALCDYIRTHDGPTMKMVADGMKVDVDGVGKEINICARDTSDAKIKEMINQRKIIDRKKGNGFHKLYLNDKDEYNYLVNTIDNLSKAITRWTNVVTSHFRLLDRRTHSGALLIRQMIYYSFVTAISNYIKNNIKSQNDIEKLYFRLSDILINLRDVNNLLQPIFIREMKNTIKKWGVIETAEEDDDFINEMIKFQSKLYSK